MKEEKKEEENKMGKRITVICYNRKHMFNSREKAIAFYEDAAYSSDGHEQERYLNILDGLKDGQYIVNDDYVLDGHEAVVDVAAKVERAIKKQFENSSCTARTYFADNLKRAIVYLANEYDDFKKYVYIIVSLKDEYKIKYYKKLAETRRVKNSDMVVCDIHASEENTTGFIWGFKNCCVEERKFDEKNVDVKRILSDIKIMEIKE